MIRNLGFAKEVEWLPSLSSQTECQLSCVTSESQLPCSLFPSIALCLMLHPMKEPDILHSSTPPTLPSLSCCLSRPFLTSAVSGFKLSSVWISAPFFYASFLLPASRIHRPLHPLTLFSAPGIPSPSLYSPIHIPFSS